MRFVTVATAANGLSAKIVAARLGAEGIVYELRGNVDGPYPIGEVEVMVEESDEPRARELLLADEVESAFDDVAEEATVPTGPRMVFVAALVLLALVAILLLRVYAAVSARESSAEQSLELITLDPSDAPRRGALQ